MRFVQRCSALSASIGISGALLLGGCAATPPAGPTLMAAPGKGKSFDQFRADDYRCRAYASRAYGGVTPQQAEAGSGVGSAVAGTALGAAAGALLGAATGSAGAGAAFGAGGGLLVGSAIGADKAETSSASLQAGYDRVYGQCMAGAGEDVTIPPVAAVYSPPVVVVAPYPYAPYPYGPYYEPRWRAGWGWGW